jgi:hypothetical protein
LGLIRIGDGRAIVAAVEDTVDATGKSQPPPSSVDTVPCGLGELLLYFLRLGTVGFGGPIALVGYMQRDLVEQRRWISSQDYVEGLALAQLSPGPLAAQLAIYLGWVRARVIGATLVGLAFVLPSFVMVVVLAALYLRFDEFSWMQGAFYGVGAAALAPSGSRGSARALAALDGRWTERYRQRRNDMEDRMVLCGGRGVRLWQWLGHSAVSLRRRRHEVPLAERSAIP